MGVTVSGACDSMQFPAYMHTCPNVYIGAYDLSAVMCGTAKLLGGGGGGGRWARGTAFTRF